MTHRQDIPYDLKKTGAATTKMEAVWSGVLIVKARRQTLKLYSHK